MWRYNKQMTHSTVIRYPKKEKDLALAKRLVVRQGDASLGYTSYSHEEWNKLMEKIKAEPMEPYIDALGNLIEPPNGVNANN